MIKNGIRVMMVVAIVAIWVIWDEVVPVVIAVVLG